MNRQSLALALLLIGSCKGTEGNVFLDKNGVSGDSGETVTDSTFSDAADVEPDGAVPDSAEPEPDASFDPDAFFSDASDPDATPDFDGGDGGLPNIDCTQNPPVFPSFDRSCLVGADCAIGTVQSDCCGTLTVTGINASESQRFADAAAVCNSQFPECDCRTQSTHADDGTREGAGRGPALVQCLANTCQTTFPVDPTECGGSLSCDPFTDVCVVTSPIGPAIQYTCEPIPAGCEQDRSCSCAGVSLCSPPHDTCTELGPNQISCECLQCA